MAEEIVDRFHGTGAGAAAKAAWEAQFSRGEVPADMPEVNLSCDAEGMLLTKVLVGAGLAKSNSEARRRIEQGAVRVDGGKVADSKHVLVAGARYVIRAGKRAWAAVTLLVD